MLTLRDPAKEALHLQAMPARTSAPINPPTPTGPCPRRLASISVSRGFVLWALVAIFTASAAAASASKPLSEIQLLGLLKGGVYANRVAVLVNQRGIDFIPTAQFLKSLRMAGANQKLLNAVKRARRIIPPTTIAQSPNNQTNTGNTAENTQAESQQPPATTALPVNDAIPPDTTITIQNWRQFQQFMPDGMTELFKGDHFWKVPSDLEIEVGPTTPEPLPTTYADATERYSRDVRVVHLPNGHNDVANYAGGEPFPNAEAPDKGYKLLVNLWFAYAPHLAVGTPHNPLTSCTQDRLGDINCLKLNYVYRQTAYNTDPRVGREAPGLRNTWFTEWVMVEKPEQSRYTAQLTIFPRDNQRNEDLYTFVPALRISIRGSLSARCSPVAGTDYIQDDYRNVGFNGGIGIFDAQFIGHRKILALTGNYAPLGGNFPDNYYMPLGWPKPSWGKWQLRDVDVIDVRRVPQEQKGYCYGKRIIYEDSVTHYALWEDVYDLDMRLWKTAFAAQRLVNSTSLGFVPGPVTSSIWDLRSGHMTNVSTEDEYGHDMLTNEDAPAEYQDFNGYSTPGGLMEIMR